MYYTFGIFHWLYLLLIIVLLIVFYFIFKDRSKTAQSVFLLCCIAICFTVSMMEMFRFVPTKGWKSVLKGLPLFACDLNVVILPLAICKKKKHPLLDKFILYYVVVGPLFTLFLPQIPGGEYKFYDYVIVLGFLEHGLYFIVAVLYLKFNRIVVDSREPWKPWLAIIVLMTAVHGINLLLYYTGANIDANYFFTMRPPANFAIVWHGAVWLGYNLKGVFCYFFMMAGYTLWTMILYFLNKVYETETIQDFLHKRKRMKKA